MPVAERQQETEARDRPSAGRLEQLAGYGQLPGPERVLMRVRLACEDNGDQRPGTEGQVGCQGGMAALVNGPEGDALDWGSINWPRVEGEVRRLLQRIF